MAEDLELKLRLNADGNLQRELKRAEGALQGLGGSARTSGREVARGIDQGTRAARESEQAMRKLESAIKALGIGLAIRAIVNATVEQEKAIAQLEATLRSTGNAAGLSSQQLQAFASELQQVTTYGDEAILAMQSVLATFKAIRGDTFKEATVAILDMSAKLGQDLKSSAIQVGKALQDPVQAIGALSRAGIQFSPAQQEMIKTMVEVNDLAGAQSVILRELESQFGGAARAARDTLGGALDGLRNAFGDLLESKDGLEEARLSVEALTKSLSDPSVVEGINKIVSGVITMVGWLGRASSEAADLATRLGEAAGRFVEGPLSETAELRRQLQFFQRLKGADLFTRTRLFGEDGFVKVYDDAEIDQRIAELKKKLEQLEGPPAKTESEDEDKPPDQTAEELARIAAQEERRKQINAELVGLYKAQLAELARMGGAAKEVADRFAQTREQINQRPSDLTAGTVLEPLNTIRAGQRSVEKGDFEAAARAAEKAREQIAALGESTKVSKQFLNDLLNRAEAVAQSAVSGQRERVEQETASIKQTLLEAGVAAAELAKIEVGFDLAAAMGSAEGLKAAIAALFAEPVIQLVEVRKVGGTGEPAAQPDGYSGGGMIRGPGGPTSDRILARLSDGEYVLRAAAVRHYGPALLNQLNAMTLPRFATGGLVSARLGAAVGASEAAAAARAGRPVTIVLDGQRFQATASDDEARALERAAMKRGRRVP